MKDVHKSCFLVIKSSLALLSTQTHTLLLLLSAPDLSPQVFSHDNAPRPAPFFPLTSPAHALFSFSEPHRCLHTAGPLAQFWNERNGLHHVEKICQARAGRACQWISAICFEASTCSLTTAHWSHRVDDISDGSLTWVFLAETHKLK